MAADEWRNCVDWLVRCQILPVDHKATKQDATAFELAQALRDGVLLCHLLNTLQPGCIDMKDFSTRPQMSQFLSMKNIRTFLQTCSTTFGMNAQDLFKPNDLFDVKDFRKVLETLSRLSKSEKAKVRFRGFQNMSTTRDRHENYYNQLSELATGFPPESRSRANGEPEEEDIYGNLRDLAVQNDLEDQEDIYDTVYQEDEEKIYDDLLNQKRFSTASSEPQTKRDHCIKELLDTENNYKEALKMIYTHFIKPLHNVLSSSDRDCIFAQIEQLLELHRDMSEKLNRAVNQGHPRLADVFITFKPRLVIYGDFCANLTKAQSRVDKVCENEMIRQKIQECERQANDGKFRLRDLLHVPMQRVLKYHLLLRELIKTTDKSNIEREGLEQALEAMQDLSLYVNEVKRDHEGLQVIEDIQSSITDLRMPVNTSLKDYGRFQKDGELKVHCHMDNKQRNRHIFLFDKVMLMCKARMVDKFLWGENYSFKDAIVLAEYKIDDSAPSVEKNKEKSTARGWNFIMVKQDRANAYTFTAKTEEQRNKWKEAVALALDNSCPAADRSYIMTTFEKPRECDVCGKLLRGVFYQGYKSQDSDKAVHKECIGKPFQTMPRRPPRPEKKVNSVRAEKPYRGIPAPPSHMKPPLYFAKDDTIEVIARPDEQWWLARLHGEEGYIPSGFVKETKAQCNGSYLHVAINQGKTQFASPPSRGSLPVPSPSVLRLSDETWYVGDMERGKAQALLDPLPDGTFLIRVTNNPTRQGELSLSIKYANAVRHIKVNRGTEGGFYLAQHRYFGTVQELVDHYRENELADSFPEVCTTLKYPYKEVAGNRQVLGHAVAIYDYAATATAQVTLQVGDRVAIRSKAGQDRGWWKGDNLRTKKTGYFPLAYVQEEDD